MKRKIRLSALLAVSVLMLALLIGGLYGYFDDTEDSIGNSFTAGTLDLEEYTNGVSTTCTYQVVPGPAPSMNGHVEFGDIAPGDSGTITWTLSNMGTVDGTLTMAAQVGGDDVDQNEPELDEPLNDVGSDGDLDDALSVELFLGATSLYAGNLDGLATFLGGYAGASLLGDGGTTPRVYTLQWQVGTGVGNIIQSDVATLDMTFTLNQTH